MTIYKGFRFGNEYDGSIYVCSSDNGSGLTYCDEYTINDDGDEILVDTENIRLTHREIAHILHERSVDWCCVNPDQWDVILAKVPEDKLEEILGNDREYREGNVGYLLQEGDSLFDGFDKWLLDELDIFNHYDR